jgi:hypothetical protein
MPFYSPPSCGARRVLNRPTLRPLQPSRPIHLPDLRLQVLWQTRLRQAYVHARFQCTQFDGFVWVAGQEDDRDVPGLRMLPDLLSGADTVQLRHRQVHDDHVRPDLNGYVDCGHTIARREDADARVRQVCGVQLAGIVKVVSNEDDASSTSR